MSYNGPLPDEGSDDPVSPARVLVIMLAQFADMTVVAIWMASAPMALLGILFFGICSILSTEPNDQLQVMLLLLGSVAVLSMAVLTSVYPRLRLICAEMTILLVLATVLWATFHNPNGRPAHQRMDLPSSGSNV